MGKTATDFEYDVVIIGAGLIGLAAADSLLDKGLSVCVTDIKAEPMCGASFCNSGMIHPSQAAPWAQLGFSDALRLSVGADVLSLAKRSAELIAARANLSGQGAAPWVEEGRVVGVRLGNRDISARHTVLAAGMHPVMEAGNCSAISIFGDVLRLSGTIGEASAEPLIQTWTKIAPRLVDALGEPLSAPWTGDRPVSLTGKPFIGRTALPGLWVNTAHGHMGWTLCAASGELLADMMVEGKTDTRWHGAR